MFWQKVSDRQIQKKKQFYKRERNKWWQVNFALTVTNSGAQAHTNTHKYTQTHRKIQNEQKLRRKGGWVMQGWDYALAAVRSKGRAADYHPSYACTQYYHLCACTAHSITILPMPTQSTTIPYVCTQHHSPSFGWALFDHQSDFFIRSFFYSADELRAQGQNKN